MKKRFTPDYFLYISAKGVTLLVRVVPLRLSIFVARALGAVAFYCLGRKRAIATKNVKTAFADYSRERVRQVVKRVFMNAAQHCIEVTYLPWIDQHYIDTYMEFENKEALLALLRDGKGAIFLGLHEGSWEIPCVVLARVLQRYHYTVLARPQKNTPLLNELLDAYRLKQGCGIVKIKESLRPLVEHLKKGYALGMVADHGAQGGIFVDFFGKPALTPTGAVKLALKLGSHLVIGFIRRKGGPAHKIIFQPYDVVKTADEEHDVKANLERINRIFENYIRQAPEEYWWFFKRWKHSPQRNILVLSDGKAGHFKQSLAVLDYLKRLPFEVKEDIVELTFRSRLQRVFFEAVGFVFGACCPEGMRRLLRSVIAPDAAAQLFSRSYDVVISCGSSVAMANVFLAQEHIAKSIVIMKPALLSVRRFDLVIAPAHDRLPARKNVVVVKGALSAALDYHNHSVQEVIKRYHLEAQSLSHPVIGFVVGGDTKHLSLAFDSIKKIVAGLKQVSKQGAATIVASTSRRTPAAIEQLLRQELQGYAACKMLILANDYNPEGAIEALFHVSDILIISGDSISMVSEALGYNKYVFVFPLARKNPHAVTKHERFMQHLENDGYISVVGNTEIGNSIMDMWHRKPPIKTLPDSSRITEALKNIV